VGFEATRKKSIQCVRQGGVIVHIGLSQPAGEFDFRKATLQEITFVGTYCYTNEDFKQSLDMLIAKELVILPGWTTDHSKTGQMLLGKFMVVQQRHQK